MYAQVDRLRKSKLADAVRQHLASRASGTAGGLYATPRTGLEVGDCAFYHVMEIPGLGVTTDAQWDLRGREPEYLGHVPLSGKRVLEIGPASGFLSFYMESHGAEVVSVELAPDLDWDIVPDSTLDIAEYTDDRRTGIEQIRNGYWLAHSRLGSHARVHYGNVYALPPALGRFDIAVLGSVLLHLRDPIKVVEQCAKLADTLVITDMRYSDLPDDRPLMHWFSTREDRSGDVWWRFSPQLFVRFAEVMGFTDNRVSFHEQIYVADGSHRAAPMFTVVSTNRQPHQ